MGDDSSMFTSSVNERKLETENPNVSATSSGNATGCLNLAKKRDKRSTVFCAAIISGLGQSFVSSPTGDLNREYPQFLVG